MFIIPAPNSVAFEMFNIPIYWYGIFMAVAIFLAIVVANFIYNRVNTNLKKDAILEFAPLLIVFGILGARLYFCFLSADYYFANPLEILDIRQGGLSIHGALIAGILGIFYFAKRSKVPVMTILDPLACATFLGQVVGRWGNYFNSEAYGLPVAGQNWGLYVPEMKRVVPYMNFELFHPTFLYESCLDLVGFFVLLFIIKKFGKTFRGLTFFSYLVLYSIIRFFVEQIRVDSALNVAGVVPIAELMSLSLGVIGVIGIACVLLKYFKSAK